MTATPNTYAEAQVEGISYKAWLYMCEQEDIEREQAEEADDEFFTALADPNSRQIFPGEDPDSICMCPACSAMRAKFEHDVALARAVLHCPEPPCSKNHFDVETGNQCPRCGRVVQRDELGREIDPPEEKQLEEAALNSPLARWIQSQLAMERALS